MTILKIIRSILFIIAACASFFAAYWAYGIDYHYAYHKVYAMAFLCLGFVLLGCAVPQFDKKKKD